MTTADELARFAVFSLMPRRALQEIIDLCHARDVLVSTGGFVEHVLTCGREAVARYLEECKRFGFDIVEVSSGFITLPADDLVRLTAEVQKAGLKVKAEVGIQFGAGGATSAEELEAERTSDPDWAIQRARRYLDAGAFMIMVESDITESVRSWRTDSSPGSSGSWGRRGSCSRPPTPRVLPGT